MYFLTQLKRAKVTRNEIILFYTCCIRSFLTYASPVFFHALPMYLKKDLERVEKRALAIICPGLSYTDDLQLSNIVSINDYIASLCNKTFTSKACYSSVSHRAMIYATKGGLLFPNVKQNVLRIVFFNAILFHQ